MVQAWYLKENITNPREPNHADPAEFISMEDLKKSTGVLYWRVSRRAYGCHQNGGALMESPSLMCVSVTLSHKFKFVLKKTVISN